MHLAPEVGIYCNPNAGLGQAAQISRLVQEQLRERQITFVELPKGLSVSETKDIIVIGGDGTFNTLLNNLQWPHKYRFILLPAGTSNSLCSQISPNETIEKKVARYIDSPHFLKTDSPHFLKTDLPQLNCNNKTYRFINEASAGFAAAIAREIEQRETKKRFNRLHLNELAYIATAFRCWRRDNPIMLSFCNNKRISGNLFPCVNAHIDDGLIDVFELNCPRLLLPFELMRLVGAKRDKSSRFVSRRQVKTASFHFTEPLPVETDGNPIGETDELTLSLYPHQIQVL